MKFARRHVLKATLTGAASLALGAPAFAQVSAQPFAQWVETFRARARAKGISDATYTRVMSGLKPDTFGFREIRNQPEFNQQLWQYINRRVSDWRIRYRPGAREGDRAAARAHREGFRRRAQHHSRVCGASSRRSAIRS